MHPRVAIFDIIVEGANLFFTQEARLQLESAGVVLYKDASANKGGVTSSSLEVHATAQPSRANAQCTVRVKQVLAALALSDAEFQEHMCVLDDQSVPKFYQEYVQVNAER